MKKPVALPTKSAPADIAEEHPYTSRDIARALAQSIAPPKKLGGIFDIIFDSQSRPVAIQQELINRQSKVRQ